MTLERSATQDRDLFDWWTSPAGLRRAHCTASSTLDSVQFDRQDVAITSSGLGLTDVNYKRNLDIVQQDRDGTTLRRWSVSRAWPVKLTWAFGLVALTALVQHAGLHAVHVVAGEWDNEADENVIESVTMTYDHFELVQ